MASTPKVLSVWAISQRWANVSPSPKMPPAHTDNPAACAASMVATRSEKLWVVQIFGEKGRGGLQVMVKPVQPRGLQLRQEAPVHNPQGGADADGHGLA